MKGSGARRGLPGPTVLSPPGAPATGPPTGGRRPRPARSSRPARRVRGRRGRAAPPRSPARPWPCGTWTCRGAGPRARGTGRPRRRAGPAAPGGRRTRGSRRNTQSSPSVSASMNCRRHGSSAPGRHQMSWTPAGRISPGRQGRSVPGGSAAHHSQPDSTRCASSWSRRSRSTSMSACSRKGRPTASSTAYPPAIHHGARSGASRRTAPSSGGGSQGPQGVSVRMAVSPASGGGGSCRGGRAETRPGPWRGGRSASARRPRRWPSPRPRWPRTR